MNTSSCFSETALSAAAPARPKAPCGWLLAVLAVVALGSSVWASGPPVSFRPVLTEGGPNSDTQVIAMADMNGDGKLDTLTTSVLEVSLGDHRVRMSIYLGNGDGTFQDPITYSMATLASQGSAQIAVGDLNGDAKPDVVATLPFINELRVYPGNGDGTLQSPTTYGLGSRPNSPVIADFDGDGKLDAAFAYSSGNTIQLCFGAGNGTIAAFTHLTTAANPGALVTADFDADGKEDLGFVTRSNSQFTYVSDLLSSPPLAFIRAIPGFGLRGIAVAVGKVNTGSEILLAIAYAENDTVVTFQPGFIVNHPTGLRPTAIAIADMNGDGKGDAVVANLTGGSLSVLRGNGDQTLELPQTVAVGGTPFALALGDLDGDGQKDVVVVNGGYGFQVLLQRHRTQIAIAAPTVYPGQPATATVSISNTTGQVTTGNVTLSVNGGAALSATLAGGQASFSLGVLPVGNYSLVANYAEQGTLAASTNSASLTVARFPTHIVFGTLGGRFTGQPLPATAQALGPANEYLGTPQFDYYLASEAPNFDTQLPGPPSAIGDYIVFATYFGNATYAEKQVQASYSIIPPAATQLTVSAPTVNTTQQAVVTVAVTSPGLVPMGNVTLSVGGGAALTAALVNGQAVFNLGNVPYGSHSLAASFAAHGGYLASSGGGTLTVNRAPSFLYVTQSPKVYYGQSIFIVGSFGVGLGPNGSIPVQCYTDSSLTTPIPPPTSVGTYFATANFAGDATYLPTSLAESFTIAQAATRIDLSVAATNANTGSPVAATGVVTFVDDTFGAFGVFIDVGTASFPPAFTYYLASDTGFANPLAGPPSSAGSYVVVANVAATANYKVSTASASFTILPAVSLVVTTAEDEDDSNSDPTIGNGTSLREALRSAQSLSGAQTITFAPGLAGQTVTLTNGWSGSGDFSALLISGNIVIQGLTGASPVTLAVGAGVPRRHFYVSGTGVLTLQNLTLTGGNCPSGGGAIFSQGILDVTGCTFTGNHSAQEGGALWNYGAGTQTQVKNSTFAGNTSVQNGGAISTACELMTLTNVTIADNSITGTVGGGIHQFNGTTRLVNTIVARNTANGSPNNVVSILATLDAANSFNNLLGVDVAGPSGSGLTHGVNGNKVGIAVASLGLGALANNGGLTPTVALLPGSPAVNGGTATGAPTTDQRGKLRPQFGVVDIGAFEQTPFDTGQTIVNVGGGFWYLGPDAVGGDLRVYRELPGQLATWVDNGSGVRLGQALDGTVLVENSNGEVYARTGSTTGLGSGWQLLSSVTAGDAATWFLGPDGLGSDAYIYRWATGGAPTYSFGYATQLSVTANGSILARNNAGDYYLRVGSNAGLGSFWQLLNQSLVSWRLLHGLPYDGTQDLANPAADGVANLLKYAFNMAPNIGDLARVNVAELPENGTAGLPFISRDAQGRLVIEFVRRKAATLPGVTYSIETGGDLTALQTLSLSGAAVVSIDATWERVTVTDPTISPNRFGRVQVNVAP